MAYYQTPQVLLYEEPREPLLHLEEIAGYLEDKLPGFSVSIRAGLLDPPKEDERRLEEYSLGWARAKVRNGVSGADPMPGETAYERRRLSDPENSSFGLLYDAHLLLPLSLEAVPPEERHLSKVHIAFTRQLIGTLDEDDGRFHARVAVLGMPTIISTTGLVEAPARDPEHYLLRRGLSSLGMGDAAVIAWEKAGGGFLRHGDPRLTEALKGYSLQAVVYQLTGEAFCPDNQCRLYNAHWQEEMIMSQLRKEKEFCREHEELIRELAAGS